MNKKTCNYCNAMYIATLVSILFATTGLRAQEQPPAKKALSETTKEFLSDPARTGSLLGSILAGATVANPLAPLLGSVAGFIIGKNSDYSQTSSNTSRRNAYINRSLVPEDGVPVTGLAGLTGEHSNLSEEIITLESSGQPVSGHQSTKMTIAKVPGEAQAFSQSEHAPQPAIKRFPEKLRSDTLLVKTEQTIALELAEKTGMGNNLQKLLADACSNAKHTQPMSSSCYYYSQ